MELNQEVLAELVASKMANDYEFRKLVGESLRTIIESKIKSEIEVSANAILKDATDAAFANWREIKLYQEACKVVNDRVTVTVNELLKEQRGALSEMVNKTLASEIAKRVNR